MSNSGVRAYHFVATLFDVICPRYFEIARAIGADEAAFKKKLEKIAKAKSMTEGTAKR